MDYKRSQRVAGLLRQEISDIISKELKDPNIGMISITRLDLTDDLRHGKVYVSVIGDKKSAKKNIAALTRAANFIRSSIGRRTDLRIVPELRFVHDASAEYAQNIDVLLNKIQEERGE